jgi:hypothetical protein
MIVGFSLDRTDVLALCPAEALTVFSKPEAMTVIMSSSSRESSITAPTMISASGAASERITEEAASISDRRIPRPPVKLTITPVAPSMVVSRRGELIACLIAT